MSSLRIAPIYGSIPSVNDVAVRPFAPDNPSNPKGSRTWNLLFPELPNHSSGRTMIAKRLKGESVGHHFHPRGPNKDPEKFLLILGSVTFSIEDLSGEKLQVNMNADEDGPTEILLPPYLLHSLDVRSDFAWFIEQQSEAFKPEVNYTANEFLALRRTLI